MFREINVFFVNLIFWEIPSTIRVIYKIFKTF